MFIKRGCNQQLPPVTFLMADLLAFAKLLLSPRFFQFYVHWALYVPPLSKNEQWLIGGWRKWKKLIDKFKVVIDLSYDHFALAQVAKVRNTVKYSKFGARDLNCRFSMSVNLSGHKLGQTATKDRTQRDRWWRSCERLAFCLPEQMSRLGTPVMIIKLDNTSSE